MPTLHCKIVPTTNQGINKLTLSNNIRSQKLTLQSAVITIDGTGFNHNAIYVRLPFLSSNQFHSTDQLGYLAFPVLKNTKQLQTFNFGGGLSMPCDHISETFEAQIFDEDLAGLTSSTHFTSIDLYFSYESAGLF